MSNRSKNSSHYFPVLYLCRFKYIVLAAYHHQIAAKNIQVQLVRVIFELLINLISNLLQFLFIIFNYLFHFQIDCRSDLFNELMNFIDHRFSSCQIHNIDQNYVLIIVLINNSIQILKLFSPIDEIELNIDIISLIETIELPIFRTLDLVLSPEQVHYSSFARVLLANHNYSPFRFLLFILPIEFLDPLLPNIEHDYKYRPKLYLNKNVSIRKLLYKLKSTNSSSI